MTETLIKPIPGSNSKLQQKLDKLDKLGQQDKAKITAVPRSLDIARKGIKTDREFSALMSALMSDLIEGSITPGVGNATVNAGGKLLKVVEMRLRYGTQCGGDEKMLQLTA